MPWPCGCWDADDACSSRIARTRSTASARRSTTAVAASSTTPVPPSTGSSDNSNVTSCDPCKERGGARRKAPPDVYSRFSSQLRPAAARGSILVPREKHAVFLLPPAGPHRLHAHVVGEVTPSPVHLVAGAPRFSTCFPTENRNRQDSPHFHPYWSGRFAGRFPGTVLRNRRATNASTP